jgi:hypothetical protein
MLGPVLLDAPALVPLPPVCSKPPQPQAAAPLVELSAGKAVRAAAIASSLLRGRSTMVG